MPSVGRQGPHGQGAKAAANLPIKGIALLEPLTGPAVFKPEPKHSGSGLLVVHPWLRRTRFTASPASVAVIAASSTRPIRPTSWF